MNHKKLTIGLFGFGVVGEGIYQVLQQTPSLQATIRRICIKHPEKKRAVAPELLTTEYDAILNDPEINVVVELINDAAEAYKIVTRALKSGKAVVSANKKLIAEHFEELVQLQREYNTPFLYEAAVCGSVPIIRNLEEYYDNDLLQSICGIVNGSTNYILTKIFEDKMGYPQALLQAQQLGFAESDPTLDVEGIDAVNKLTILLAHSYGIISHPSAILHQGISRLHAFDANLAAERGLQIRLAARARKLADGKVAAFVLPHFISPESQLYGVKNEYNGVVIESSLSDKQFLYGKGAGRFPTSSAVLSDISALRYDYRYEYRKLHTSTVCELTDDFFIRVYVSFSALSDLNLQDFEAVEEFFCREARQYLVGVIHFRKLKEANWLKNREVSLIASQDAIIENIGLLRLKKRSLELAGDQYVNKTDDLIRQVQESGIPLLHGA